ncbi:hypothetical protein LCGC14_0754230 [marine sediment metagenome]|uniref:Uncharacterized protein n=1 Tax=marine sediment metagenome TaxID=412755 RepID=A0A0F9TA32_9ZZZZ
MTTQAKKSKRTRPSPRTINGDAAAPDESRMEKALISPQLAEEWLNRNTQNRPCASPDVKRISREIELGHWKINGETIKFDKNNVLRDGQTRLKSIVATKTAVWCWVAFDLDLGMEVFETIDQGRLRSLGHLLSIRGYKNYNHLAGATRLVYALDTELVAEPGGFKSAVGLSIVEERPQLVDSLERVYAAGISDAYSIGAAAALHHMMQKRDHELADSYWDMLATGVIKQRCSPAKSVRDTLLSNKNAAADKQLKPTHLQAIAIKGWNLTRGGKTCKYVRWHPEREAFPEIY